MKPSGGAIPISIQGERHRDVILKLCLYELIRLGGCVGSYHKLSLVADPVGLTVKEADAGVDDLLARQHDLTHAALAMIKEWPGEE